MSDQEQEEVADIPEEDEEDEVEAPDAEDQEDVDGKKTGGLHRWLVDCCVSHMSLTYREICNFPLRRRR